MTYVDSSSVAFLIVDGYNLLGVSTGITDEGLERETVEKLYLGDTLRRKKLTGVSKAGMITQQGSFDDAAGSSHAVLKPGGIDRVLAYALAGNTIGSHFVGAVCDQVAYEPTVVIGDFTEANARYNIKQHESGLLLTTLQTITADGDTEATPVDNGAASNGGGVAYLQCTALTLGGYTDLTVTVRHSADGIVWADLEAFTDVAAIGGERLIVSDDPINRYLAVDWVFNGAGAGQSATFVVGFYRNQ